MRRASRLRTVLRIGLPIGLALGLLLGIALVAMNAITSVRIDRDGRGGQAAFELQGASCVKVVSREFPFVVFRCERQGTTEPAIERAP